jgi:flagellin-like hook-associated protein FlgL
MRRQNIVQITNNPAAFATYTHYRTNVSRLRQSISRLASGLRIASAQDDPGGLAISERLRTQIRNSAAAAANVENSINYFQAADLWLQKIQDMLGRMSELAVMANDGAKSQNDRESLQREFEQMQKEIQRITSGATAAAKFNGLYLLRGGTGVPGVRNDLVVGAHARVRGQITMLAHDGSRVTSAQWQAVYDASAGIWTVTNLTTGAATLVACAPDQACSVVLEDPVYGYRLDILAPQGGTFLTGDTLTWETVAYTPPVMGVPSLTNGTLTPGALTCTALGTGEGVSTGNWRATYDAATELWSVYREGVLQGTIAATPESAASADFEGINGFRLSIAAPVAGSYATGDQFTWNNVASLAGATTFFDASGATTGTAATSINGTGASISSHAWRATYNAFTRQWQVRDMTTNVLVGVINSAPNAGGFLDVEGPNGFRITINAPTPGTYYTTNDRFDWTNRGLPLLGNVSFADNNGTTTGSASTAVQGTGAGLTVAAWRATYNPLTQRWTVRNMTTGVDVATVAAAPNAGAFVPNLGGVNGFSLNIAAPTAGSEYTLDDRFDWTTRPYSPPAFGALSFQGQTGGSGSIAMLGNGLGVTTANWSATYDADAQLWTIRNETTGVNVATISADPNSGGSIGLEGGNGFTLTLNAPVGGPYQTGDRFTWSNTQGLAASAGSPAFTDNRQATTGSAAQSFLGTGNGVTSASWRATYDAVGRQWVVENLTVPATYFLAAEPNVGGFIDLEGPNGFRFTVNAPTSRLYNTGDRFTWTNLSPAPPAVGTPVFTDDAQATSGTATTLSLGTGRDITTANWSATYDVVPRTWTIRNETLGIDVMSFVANPNAGGTVTPEGPNGFRLTINAPTAGSNYTTGDRFTWSNVRLIPPSLQNNIVFTPGPTTVGGASIAYQADGYGVTGATWRATYSAAQTRWEIRNMNTGAVAGFINASPTAGGSLSNIEGAFGFTLTIAAPTAGVYSTGDYFEWRSAPHVAARSIGPYFESVDADGPVVQVGPDSNQIFVMKEIDLQAQNYRTIGSYVSYSYGSVNMTLLGSVHTRVRWGSLIAPDQLGIADQAMAQGAVDKLNMGVDYLSSIRALVGAQQNRMTHTLQGLRNYEENIRAVESRVRDVDVAWETTTHAKYNILSQIGMALLAQANSLSGNVLKLIGG